MNLAIILSLGAVLVVGLVLAVISIRYRQQGSVIRSLNTSLYKIVLPKEGNEEEEKSEKKEEHKVFKNMEQLLVSFMSLRTRGLNALIYGQPYISLELAVEHVGDKVMSYIAVPRSMDGAIEKQVHSIFPYAEVTKATSDYNIFAPGGITLASWARSTRTSILPLNTYEKLSADPLAAIVTAMSKLAKEGEGVAVQYILRPADFKKQRELAKKVIKEMNKGHDFSSALSQVRGAKVREVGDILLTPPKDATGVPQTAPKEPTAAADEAFIKELQTKITKHHFATNIRLVVSAVQRERAEQILTELESAYLQFNNPVGNSLAAMRVSRRKMRKFVFDYSFRIPSVKRSCLFSTEELASLYHLSLAQAGVPGYKTLRSKILEPPGEMPDEGLILGENNYRGERTIVRMSDDDRRRHLYVIGQTGTGKTTLFKEMIKQDVEAGRGLATLDPHG
ncbi:MAG: hypothetical protein PHV43_03445, partial [Candidatus Colwellbacteria bacterium]|nr:hypothetical protein [Candidatus Colwellbacteria bacterium]